VYNDLLLSRPLFSKVLCRALLASVYSKCSSALTFENFFQAEEGKERDTHTVVEEEGLFKAEAVRLMCLLNTRVAEIRNDGCMQYCGACRMRRRRMHACHMRRRMHACHMRRRMHAILWSIYLLMSFMDSSPSCSRKTRLMAIVLWRAGQPVGGRWGGGRGRRGIMRTKAQAASGRATACLCACRKCEAVDEDERKSMRWSQRKKIEVY
jgi:hypothetical protein